MYPFPVVEFEKAFNLNEGPRHQECLAQMRGQVERLAAVLREAEQGSEEGGGEGEAEIGSAEGLVREAEKGAKEGEVREVEHESEKGLVGDVERGSEEGVVRDAGGASVQGGVLVDADAPHNGTSDHGGTIGCDETACVAAEVCAEVKGWCTGSGQGQEVQRNGEGATAASGVRGEGRPMVVDDVEGAGARGSEGSVSVTGADAGAGEDSAVVSRAGAEAGAGGSAACESTTGEGSVATAGTEECATAKEAVHPAAFAAATMALGEEGVDYAPDLPVLRPLAPALALSEGQAERLRCVLDEMLDDRQCVFLLLGCR